MYLTYFLWFVCISRTVQNSFVFRRWLEGNYYPSSEIILPTFALLWLFVSTDTL